MMWRFFYCACLLLIGLDRWDEERRHKRVIKQLQEMQATWYNSPVESR